MLGAGRRAVGGGGGACSRSRESRGAEEGVGGMVGVDVGVCVFLNDQDVMCDMGPN